MSQLLERTLAAVTGPDGTVRVEALHELVDLPDDHTERSVTEVAELLGVSPHTLRYYERIGLVHVERDAGGHRVYDAAAVRRLLFLTRMRLSGMGIRDLQQYVELVEAGEGTVPERLDMLLEHRDTVRRQILELQVSLSAIEYKIATYGGSCGS